MLVSWPDGARATGWEACDRTLLAQGALTARIDADAFPATYPSVLLHPVYRVKRLGLILLIHTPMTDPRMDKPAANKYPDRHLVSIRGPHDCSFSLRPVSAGRSRADAARRTGMQANW